MSLHQMPSRNPPPPPDVELTARVAKLEAVTEGIDKRLSLIEIDIRAIGKKLDTHFYITWGGIIGLGVMLAKALKLF